MVVIAVLGILASFSIPFYLDHIRHSKDTQCTANRKAIERAAIVYYNTFDQLEGYAIPGVGEFTGMGYFDMEPKCPDGGLYLWARGVYSEDQLPLLGCSYHYIPPVTTEPETPVHPGKSSGGKGGQS